MDKEVYVFDPRGGKGKAHEAATEEPAKHLSAVVTETAKDKDSRSLGKKILSLFISEDVKDIKGYILKEVVVPTVKNTLSDVVNMTLGLGSTRSTGGRLPFERIAYGSYYGGANKAAARTAAVPENTSPENRALIFHSRSQAELLLETSCDVIERYNKLSLNDFYELAGRPDLCSVGGANYGWTSLHAAKIVQSGHDWMVAMPKVYAL